MIIAVEIKHLEEVLAMFFGEDRVFSDDISGEDCFFVLLGIFLSTVKHIQN